MFKVIIVWSILLFRNVGCPKCSDQPSFLFSQILESTMTISSFLLETLPFNIFVVKL